MLTGKDIADAICRMEETASDWQELPPIARAIYNELAHELNATIEAQQCTAFAVRCHVCSQLVEAEHCANHACFASSERTEPLEETEEQP